ncbi:MAG: MotA/TolQ/ExbB proton channel family protein [Planctomycetia bacterium]|nr:MotA/TolQ/ExbB proton channel family protein [Planctomycetia bacterium]
MDSPNPVKMVQRVVYSPILWGIAVTGVFYALIMSKLLPIASFLHYFCTADGEILGIPFVEVLMFFIGFSALGFKCADILFQSSWVAKQERAEETFFPKPTGGGAFTPSDAVKMVRRLEEIPEKIRRGYFIQRLKSSLDYIVRNQSAKGFTDEMKYLADLDVARMGQSYSFIRVVIWAIPILGFLGTVMGITLAIGGLGGNLSDTESTLPKMIADLSFAFDTTALALSFSIVLMFFQFYVEKMENRLLDRVDEQTNRELAGRFEEYSDSLEGVVQAMRTQGDAISKLMENQARRQAAIWEEAFRNVEMEWTRRLDTVAVTMTDSLQKAYENASARLALETASALGTQLGTELEKTLQNTVSQQWMNHVSELKEIQRALDSQCGILRDAMAKNVEFFEANNTVLTQNSQKITDLGLAVSVAVKQLSNMTEVTENMAQSATKIADGGERIAKMENVLAQNLSTLQGARDFEQTVAQLAVVVNGLTQWLNEVKAARR